MDGTEEQKRLYLPRVAAGELIMSFALTEPDAGSDSAAVKTRGERVVGQCDCGRRAASKGGQISVLASI